MDTITEPSPVAVPDREEEFLHLICADEELLRAEFDAIIAAEWPTPPPRRPAGRTRSERPRPDRRRQARFGDQRRTSRSEYPGVGGWGRPRSPPPDEISNPHTIRNERTVMTTR